LFAIDNDVDSSSKGFEIELFSFSGSNSAFFNYDFTIFKFLIILFLNSWDIYNLVSVKKKKCKLAIIDIQLLKINLFNLVFIFYLKH